MGERDGNMDFSGYSLTQLRDLQRLIDRNAFPLDFAGLATEIERRGTTPDPAPAHDAGDPTLIDGRFTRSDGWVGWLQALRRRSPLFGAGALEFTPDGLRLIRTRRTWLGASAPLELSVPTERIRDCAADGGAVRFEIRRRFLPARTVTFDPAGERDVDALLARLPSHRSARFDRHWLETREFNARLRGLGGRVWLAPALVLVNVAVFVAMLIVSRSIGPLELARLMDWGANFGPLTTSGQWWRLFSAMFLHGNWLHLTLNMWVLWNVGRLTERLYGTAVFAFLYLASGLCGGLARLVWEPSTASIGASGAIFGIVGALLAMLLNRTARIPRPVAFAYWPSTLAFALFNLLGGFFDPVVDNAAHVGGLLSGFLFGWVWARPVDREMRRSFPLRNVVAATACIVVIGAACFAHLRTAIGHTSVTERFFIDRPWYPAAEAANLSLWSELADRATQGTISESELEGRFEKDIIPFWADARKRLEAEAASGKVAQDQQTFHARVLEFVRARLDWAEAVRAFADERNQDTAARAAKAAAETQKVTAAMQRLTTRAAFDQRPRALAASAPVMRVRSWFSSGARECVLEMPQLGNLPAFSDSTGDGPKMRQKAGCQAQRLFVMGDYPALEDLIASSAGSLGDLPDGSSSLNGVMGGLDDYFFYGGNDIENLLGKVSDWRRSVDDPIGAELAEVLIFQNWAWSARGFGGANSVSPESWKAFQFRTEMAAAGLSEIRERGLDHPYWHQVSLNVGLDQSFDESALEEIFEEAARRFPDYLPIYTARLRTLMTRWSGSLEKVDSFIRIAAESRRGKLQPDELYAALYATYSSLEDDEIDLFARGLAEWPRIEDGFRLLRQRHPSSGMIVNQFAKVACMAGDAEVYRNLRPVVERNPASLAWSEKHSTKTCDARFAAPKSVR